MAAEPFLSVRDIRKRFGGVTALDGVNLDVPAGRGLRPDRAERLRQDDAVQRHHRLRPARPRRRSASAAARRRACGPTRSPVAASVRTFQSSARPRRMTVMENMLLAPQAQTGERLVSLFVQPGTVRAEERAQHRACPRAPRRRQSRRPRPTTTPAVSPADRRSFSSLAQALMAEPRLILLDEPVAGVNPMLIDEIADVIRRLSATAATS